MGSATEATRSIRFPAALYRRLKKTAEGERRSVNGTVVVAVEMYIDRAKKREEEK